MGVKNNFSQAVSELIGISRATEEAPKPEETGEEVKQADEKEAAAVEETKESTIDDKEEEPKSVEKEDVDKGATSEQVMTSKEKILAMLSQQQTNQQTQQQPEQQPQPINSANLVQSQPNISGNLPQRQSKPVPGLTTIAQGTVIVGEINAEGDVELLGSVKGKVSSKGDIRVNGKVVGDLLGKDIELRACAVQGNIVATGFVNVDGESLVIGDVKCESFSLDGKIKGNVSVGKEAKFQPKAILSGNVTTASIAMSQGAKIQGEVNIPLNEKETDMSFDMEITI